MTYNLGCQKPSLGKTISHMTIPFFSGIKVGKTGWKPLDVVANAMVVATRDKGLGVLDGEPNKSADQVQGTHWVVPCMTRDTWWPKASK
jgi:hypothetical protein